MTTRPAERDAPAQWSLCPSCNRHLYLPKLRRNLGVCQECSHHLRLGIDERLETLLDPGGLRRYDADLTTHDPLGFVDRKPYTERLAAAREATGRAEAAVWGTGAIGGYPVVLACLDFTFMGGSVGAVTGELIARAARHALETRTPLILVSASGGARMQEGTLSLMQLAKTAQELGRLREEGVLSVNVNTDPTYGGATASFSVLGDVVIAEPGARVGFAGPQVIRQTIRQELPKGFQTAEFLRSHGLLDLVVPRHELRSTLTRLLALHTDRSGGGGSAAPAAPEEAVAPGEAGGARGRVARAAPSALSGPSGSSARTAAESVALARDIGRPTTLDYCGLVFEDFLEFHGDRVSGDDLAIVAGVASLDGRPVVVLGHQKGHDTAELVRRNFGMPQPSGYHKARRLMEHAERHRMPVVAFIDTPGAHPGIEAEERGQGAAIAECILGMARLTVPTVAIVTGEGGSGGALALGVGNRVLILENAYYSVISPEGCSTILFGSAAESAKAAEQLRIGSTELLCLGIVDGIVPEPPGGAHTDRAVTAEALGAALRSALAEFDGVPADRVVALRHERFARFGNPTKVQR
ncbi:MULTISPECIES: acetyl-CoA carboxylase carboxyltransferase subunit alpha [unclassified Nocardiopsis]|uniref:acetyl-CoA carboxylase carboxyltransferase subunit alpha n=1 Tax=Nocardiopsis TaxID=2013 RepID=UPI00387B13B2